MPDNVKNLPPKPKATRAFKNIMIFIFSFLIIMKASEIIMGPSFIERKHRVKFFKQPIDINDNYLETMDGKQLKFSDFNGKKIIIALWAPWCKYCAEEFPQISRIEDQLHKKGYMVIPLVKNIEPKKDIENFYRKLRIEGIPPFITGDKELYYKLRSNAFPNFFLVNDQGEAVANIRPNWGAGDILQLFSQLNKSTLMQGQESSLNP